MSSLQFTMKELKRLFIDRFPYIISLLIWVVVALWLTWIPEQTVDYERTLTSIQQNHALALRLADQGDDFKQYELFDPGFNFPDGYPLRDENGNLILGNISFVKDFIADHYNERQAALTAHFRWRL